MKYNCKQIEKILKINFNNKKLLIKSLVHKSFDKNVNNEKLEFLGDRVIGLVISEKLLALYPDEKEGIIDKKFANLVNKKTCAKIARQLNLKKFIKTAKSYKNLKSSDEKILSDGCEALIGAIYLDQGFAISEKFILRNWNNFIKRSNIIEVDSKTKLQEYSLKKYKKLPLYTTFKQTGAKHNPTFKIHVQIPKSKNIPVMVNQKKLPNKTQPHN
jgi:ribonuclease-3